MMLDLIFWIAISKVISFLKELYILNIYRDAHNISDILYVIALCNISTGIFRYGLQNWYSTWIYDELVENLKLKQFYFVFLILALVTFIIISLSSNAYALEMHLIGLGLIYVFLIFSSENLIFFLNLRKEIKFGMYANVARPILTVFLISLYPGGLNAISILLGGMLAELIIYCSVLLINRETFPFNKIKHSSEYKIKTIRLNFIFLAIFWECAGHFVQLLDARMMVQYYQEKYVIYQLSMQLYGVPVFILSYAFNVFIASRQITFGQLTSRHFKPMFMTFVTLFIVIVIFSKFIQISLSHILTNFSENDVIELLNFSAILLCGAPAAVYVSNLVRANFVNQGFRDIIWISIISASFKFIFCIFFYKYFGFYSLAYSTCGAWYMCVIYNEVRTVIGGKN